MLDNACRYLFKTRARQNESIDAGHRLKCFNLLLKSPRHVIESIGQRTQFVIGMYTHAGGQISSRQLFRCSDQVLKRHKAAADGVQTEKANE